MKKKEPQGDSDELSEGLSALSLTEKENNVATVRSPIVEFPFTDLIY